MKAKRPHASLPPSPDKPVPSGKKARFEDPSPPEAEISSPTNDVDMSEGEADAEDQPLPATDNGDFSSEEYVDAEDEPLNGGSTSDDSEFRTSPQSATCYGELEQNSGSNDSPNYDSESSPSTSVVQDPALIDQQLTHHKDSVSAEKASTITGDRASNTLVNNWPATSRGVTQGICDLKTLRQFMASDKINADHKAMWVSLVQTIIYEPDRNSVLEFLQNTLSGDAIISDHVENRSRVPHWDRVNQREWAVTGSLTMYGEQKERWSAAHFIDLALWVGGPDAGIQAARALKIFGVWNPSANFSPTFAIHSIGDCLSSQDILRSIWPDENDGRRLLAWANCHRPTTEQPFDRFMDAHLYLLRHCIGENLKLFPPMARNFAQVGDVNSRIISRAYYDSTLAPILLEHFDASVDIELAYKAVETSQGKLLDRNPVKHITPTIEPRPAVPHGHGSNYQDKGRLKQRLDGRGQHDDGEDDSEGNYRRPATPIKEEPNIEQEVPSDQNEFLKYSKAYGPRVTRRCLKIIKQVLLERQTIKLPRNEVSRRLRAKYRICRSPKSIGTKWCDQWRHLPESEALLRQIGSTIDKGDESDEPDESDESGEPDYEGDETGDADDAGHADDADESDDMTEDAAEDGAEKIEDTAQNPPERSVDERSSLPHRQSRSPQDFNSSRVTRRMAKLRAEERTTNDLYQQSLSISSEIITQCINTKPLLTSNWKQVLEHRTTEGMLAVGLADRPPYPLNNLLMDTPTPSRLHHTFSSARATLVSGRAEIIKEDVKRLLDFAQS